MIFTEVALNKELSYFDKFTFSYTSLFTLENILSGVNRDFELS